MATITEDYVSFEIAKLLKEKGFDKKYPLIPCYKEDNGEFIDIPTTLDTINYCFIPAPTLQMAMKWLREVHNLSIEIYVLKNFDKKICEYTYTIMDLNFPGSDDGIECCIEYETYEQACEAAIKYCIEHLI